MGNFKHLRSLFLSYRANYDEKFVDELSKIFKASKSIRLLDICAPSQERISEMIGCLTHLRYFKLTYEVDQLPRSISQLYNLRYLTLPWSENCMIYEIGKLKSLQELNCFYVKNEIGYGIEELEHMNELRQISIIQLENIKDAVEAWSAKFYDKKNLTGLSLQWGGNSGGRKNIVDHDLDEKILDGIQPYNNLKELCINGYMGVRSAMWMNDVYLTSTNLEYIELNGCLKWKALPPFGQLRFLKSLYLQNMPEVEQFDHNKDCTFPSLEVLRIENLKALHEWFDTTEAIQNGCFLCCLTELFLKNCPKLQELPSLPTKLQKLKMDNIGWKGCNWLQGIRNCSSIDIQKSPNLIYVTGRQELKNNENCELIIDELVINDPSLLLLEPLRSISSLRFLTIEENDELFLFQTEAERWFLQLSSSLLKLKFYNLQSLQSLPSSLESLSSLETLHVSFVPQLKLLPNPPPSLVSLELYNLESLQCLLSSSSTFSSLKCLQLAKIPLLKSLPDLPSSLESLMLVELKLLQYLPSLSTISSLTNFTLRSIPLLQSLPDLQSLQCQPSSLSAISSLETLKLIDIPLLKSLPDLPSSLSTLYLEDLESLQWQPSSLLTFSSLKILKLKNIPLLKSLPDFPSSLEKVMLKKLESLQCLPSSLSTISSLTKLKLKNIPLIKSLPDLPSSLEVLDLSELENLDCLPSCLPASLKYLWINKVSRLLELPDLPPSFQDMYITNCHPQLMERYPNSEENKRIHEFLASARKFVRDRKSSSRETMG